MKIADLFCGAGGSSTGMMQAARSRGVRVDLTAINHWDRAIETHSANHPEHRHLCASLDALNPRDLYADGELDVLWGTPECTHHSVARGGRPIRDQSRATAWCVVRWAEALRPKRIFVENVKEFQDWGPLLGGDDDDGQMALGFQLRPDPKRKGQIFKAWVAALESCGYRVEWRVLCAADYGAPTTRRRLFVQAALGNRPITWPAVTHAQDRWIPARDIIDMADVGESIFSRKRPLAAATMRRIMVGLRRYGLSRYLISIDQQSGKNGCRSIDDPVQTIVTKANVAMVTPFLLPQQSGGRLRPVTEPAPTVSTSGAIGLVSPYLVKFYGTADGSSIEDPVPTVTSKDRFGLATPAVIEHDGERYQIDIRFRMLRPHELSKAQGFPADYQFAGTQAETVKQIGNAVPPPFARALLGQYL